jgi:hypothetical protein
MRSQLIAATWSLAGDLVAAPGLAGDLVPVTWCRSLVTWCM